MLDYMDRWLTRMFCRLANNWEAETEKAYVRLLSFGGGELHDPAMTADETEAARQRSVIVPVHKAPIDTERRLGGEAKIMLVDGGPTDSRASSIVVALPHGPPGRRGGTRRAAFVLGRACRPPGWRSDPFFFFRTPIQ